MRRHAKPFTVEIKRTRRDLLPAQAPAGFAEPEPAKHDAAPVDRSTEVRGRQLAGAESDWAKLWVPAGNAPAAEHLSESAITAPAPAARRILPDLTWTPPAAPVVALAEAETGRRRKADSAFSGLGEAGPLKTRAPRKAKKPVRPEKEMSAFALWLQDDEGEDNVPVPAARPAVAPASQVVRRRMKRIAPESFAAGERWKRRLPRAAR